MEDFWTCLSTNWASSVLTGVVAGVVLGGIVINFLKNTVFKKDGWVMPEVGDLFIYERARWITRQVFPIKNSKDKYDFIAEFENTEEKGTLLYFSRKEIKDKGIEFFNPKDRISKVATLPSKT